MFIYMVAAEKTKGVTTLKSAMRHKHAYLAPMPRHGRLGIKLCWQLVEIKMI